jgi:molybdate transport system substrate-binding protein
MKRFLCMALAVSGCISGARADEITVSAAASLQDALRVASADFSKSRPQTRVAFNFGSSNTLQKQIEAGAPVDVFLSAATKNMDALAAQGEIDVATRRIVARGELVLIAPRGSKLQNIAQLRLGGVRSLALGASGVPVGDYARQTLSFLKLSAALKPKIVLARDARAVLSLVASGNADAGFVYKTDALSSPAVRIVVLVPPKSHAPILYPMAIVAAAPNKVRARAFWNYLQSARAKRIFRRFGFR